MKKICEELKKAISQKPLFDVVGGCGVDLSNGESSCMQKDGIWFQYCPFCGKKIVSKLEDGGWNWWEK